ncbi:MAG: AraC family transcriptional regulator [Flavobacteriaceae bacterium]
MEIQPIIRKNNDKSPDSFYNEIDCFDILRIKNNTGKEQRYFHNLDANYIQIYFCLSKGCTIAFNMEHCKIDLTKDETGLIYYKDTTSNLFYTLKKDTELAVILIPLKHFHSLFSTEDNSYFNFENIKLGKPIIEVKKTKTSVKAIIHQLFNQKINESLRSLYTRGKVYELLSLYLNMSDNNDTEQCPFIANEDTVLKIKQAKDIIITEMSSPPSLDELSKKVGLNLKKLKTGFKDLYGMPVFTFLFNYKMDQAKKLLLQNENNVNEVALQVGYSTSSHFIVAFKKKFGITPKQFTKQETN